MGLATATPGTDCAAAARSAYEALAPSYDDQTADYRHDLWVPELERLALEHGLAGRRVLDVACGTGKSFAPLLERGYDVAACDISPGMVAIARRRLGEPGKVFVADMRALPEVGAFDLVTCLDDAVNYLLEPADLEAALASMRSVLRPGGLLLFDTNTLLTYRSAFAMDWVYERGQRLFCWRGEGDARAAAGGVSSAVVDVFSRVEGDRWTRSSGRHLQRHHPREAVERALDAAGLTLRAVRGQRRGARLSRLADEELHSKLVFLAQRPEEGP